MCEKATEHDSEVPATVPAVVREAAQRESENVR